MGVRIVSLDLSHFYTHTHTSVDNEEIQKRSLNREILGLSWYGWMDVFVTAPQLLVLCKMQLMGKSIDVFVNTVICIILTAGLSKQLSQAS